MKLTAKNIKHTRAIIYDFSGVAIPFVKSFNTKTYETEIYLAGMIKTKKDSIAYCIVRSELKRTKNSFSSKPITIKIKIKGAYAVVDGQKITN